MPLVPTGDYTKVKGSDALSVAAKRGVQVEQCEFWRDMCVACIRRAEQFGNIPPQD